MTRMAGGVMAEFPDDAALRAAAAAIGELGFRSVETYSPMPVNGVDQSLHLSPSRLPRVMFAAGLLGGMLGYGIQWYANVGAYVVNAGGRPAHAIPAFMLATFEATILGAALGGFSGLMVALRLPALWHPVFEVPGFERASADRYWLAIGADDPRFDARLTRSKLATLGAMRVVQVPEDRA